METHVARYFYIKLDLLRDILSSMQKGGSLGNTLDDFVKKIGAPEHLTFDDFHSQVGNNTKFSIIFENTPLATTYMNAVAPKK